MRHYIAEIGGDRKLGVARVKPAELPAATMDGNWHVGYDVIAGGGVRWFGADEWTARKRLESGWPEGAEQVARLAASIRDSVPAPVSVRRRRAWRDDGSDVHLDRAMRGEWEHAFMRSEQSPRISTAQVQIAFLWSFSARRTADEIAWTGAAAVAATDALESEGWQAGVSAISLVGPARSRSGDYSCCVVDVKEVGESVNLAAMAAAVSAPSYRHYGIVTSCSTRPFSQWMPGCGPIAPLTVERMEMLQQYGAIDPGAYVVMDQAFSREQAIRSASNAVAEVTRRALALSNGEVP